MNTRISNTSDCVLMDASSLAEQDAPLVLILEPRPLLRQLLQGFIASSAQMRVVSAPSIKEWLRSGLDMEPSIILLSIPDGGRLPGSLSELPIAAHDRLASVPIVVHSNDRPGHQVLELLRIGAHGFIPTSVSTEVAVQALRLICAGGTYVPPSCLQSLPYKAQGASDGAGFLTGRQLQVVEAIRQGKPNKIIAYELNMCESTVKVHVRAIMKKLKARNRTEVAYLYSSSLGEADGAVPN
ncbi:MAG TPA: response regulator transcription factor [Amaricoccus sp.]|uniref:response regulator transcription factor n=1 Tax=Amaricoccus sp. TaxID=1872485 RepID=UPI002CAB36ED|nr:response regulator transcription factor [Amaricoccus sp.]HMQ92211.1 response regulator transcription factor [Amaricoccus sp.]HMR51667.1 response regulator transcription factor [Amaricoccus sp.]HMR59054.1 response regulator transcription factor [Amaricoccus sp.]HMT98397.1 response regulator transcription factor [Amaricoccus sp.]